MNLKETLKEVRNELLKNPDKKKVNDKQINIVENEKEEKKSLDEVSVNSSCLDESFKLENKINNFIIWYYKNMIRGNYTEIGEFYIPIDMRNFIEKMAVWYELRYPDYEINRLIPGSVQESIEINDVMFNRNNYIEELFDKEADIKGLDWSEFYNTKVFINSLPWNERYLLEEPKYRDFVYLDLHKRSTYLHLTPKGFVESAEEIGSYTNFKIKDDEIKGMHIKDVVNLLKEKGVSLATDNDLEEAIKEIEKYNYQKE